MCIRDRQHPEQTLPLLSRVYPYLLSKQWETRVTAARAVGGIVSHAPLWDPNADDEESKNPQTQQPLGPESAKVKIEEEMKVKLEELSHTDEWNELQDDTHYFTLNSWKISELLKSGKSLLAASANDYESKALNINNNGSADIEQDDANNVKHLKKEDSFADLKKENSTDSLADEDTVCLLYTSRCV